MTSSSPGAIRPPARLTAARAPGTKRPEQNLSSPSDAPRTSDPLQAAARASLPASPPTMSNNRRCGSSAAAIRPRRPVSGTRYIVSSPVRLKALFAEI